MAALINEYILGSASRCVLDHINSVGLTQLRSLTFTL